jgi:hypothetical protein
MFSTDVRPIDVDLTVVLITHPRPPNFPVELVPGKPILAPYFTAILFNPSSPTKPNCFVLGQTLKGTATLRSVEAGSHGACMAGCSPQLEDFLSLVVLVQRDGIHAARKKYPPV